MKKILTLGLVILLSFTVIIGCTPVEESSTETPNQADISKESTTTDTQQQETETEDTDQQSDPQVEDEQTDTTSKTDKDKSETTTDEDQDQTEEIKPGQMDNQEYIKYLLTNSLGTETIKDKNMKADYDYTDNALTLKVSAKGHEKYSAQEIRNQLFTHSKNIINQAFNDRQDLTDIKLIWYLYIVDQKDGEQGGKASTIEISRDKFEEVNWQEAPAEDLPDNVNDFWIHPAL
ncbi:MAG: hypothetical protein ACQEQI_08440 [Bacillota bacterium]